MSSETPHPVTSSVTAVVVTRGVTRYLPATLSALASSTLRPHRVLVVDVGSDGESVAQGDLPAALGEAILLRAPGARTMGEAIRTALAEVGPRREPAAQPGSAPTASPDWLWLLHDDSAPEPDALRALRTAVDLAPSVGVAGAKQRDWDHGHRLLEAGVTTSRFGRRITSVTEGEIDQGQRDGREDVLGVGTAGMLVRRDVWDALHGTDPALGPFLDGLDLSRRARLAGHRVVVVPGAVVRHAQASLHGLRGEFDEAEPDVRRSFRARRRALLHTQLAWVPAVLVPVVAALAIVMGAGRALIRVVTKEPGLAAAEIGAVLGALGRPGAVLRARRQARAGQVLSRRALRPLQITWREVFNEHRERRLSRKEKRRTVRAPSELELRELAALTLRRRLTLAGVLVTLGGLTAAAWGPLLTAVQQGARLAGGALAPAAYADAAGWWRAATLTWIPGGLGEPGPSDPMLLALSPLAAVTGGAPGVVVLLGAVVLAGAGAWAAAGAATRSVTVRAWAALVWAAAPALLVGAGQGRVGAVLAHVALPWVALGLARAVGAQRVDIVLSGLVGAQRAKDAESEPRDLAEPLGHASDSAEPADDLEPTELAAHPGGSIAAAGGASLALVLVTAGAPVLLLAALVLVPVVAAIVPRRRLGVLLTLVPSLAVHGPVLAEAVSAFNRPVADGGGLGTALRTLLGDPGLPLGTTVPETHELLLGWPVAPGATPAVFDSVFGVDLLAGLWWPVLATAIVALLAALGLARGAHSARGVRVGWLVAATGLLAAVASARLPVAAGDTEVVVGWAGAGLSLALLGVLAAAVLAVDGTQTRMARYTFGWRQAAAGVVALCAVLAPAGQLLAWTLDQRAGSVDQLAGPRLIESLERSIVPAVGRQAQTSADSSRVLVLEAVVRPAGAATDVLAIRGTLLRGDGPSPTETAVSVAARGLTGPLSSPVLVPADEADAGLQTALAHLAAGTGEIAAPLRDRAVAILLVPQAAGGSRSAAERALLVGRLDATLGLERITENEMGATWRVRALDATTTSAPGTSGTAVAADDSGDTQNAPRAAEPAPAWASVLELDASGAVVRTVPVASSGLRVDTELAPLAADGTAVSRRLVLADRADSGWRATLDGSGLRAVESDWRQSFALPVSGGTLSAAHRGDARSAWALVQAITVGFAVLLAVPIRRRRGVVR